MNRGATPDEIARMIEGAAVLMFAAAAALWLAILIGLGLLDPFTRAMFPMENTLGEP
jgi:hypothetical protein